MNRTDPWHCLRTGNTAKGLKEFERNYEREPEASEIMELGVAYLWVRQYEKAWEHFRKSIKDYPQSMSSFYGMAGTARWCLGDVIEAVRQWREGLKSDYADTLGLGIHLPLLLLVGSILRPGSFEKQSALKFLEEKARDDRVSDWPGQIALWALGEIDARELRNQCGGHDEVETYDRQWLASFYDGVLSYRVGKEGEFKDTMRRLTDTSGPRWADDDFFLARMWSEEFFLARHEAEVNST